MTPAPLWPSLHIKGPTATDWKFSIALLRSLMSTATMEHYSAEQHHDTIMTDASVSNESPRPPPIHDGGGRRDDPTFNAMTQLNDF
uniref:Uncharacterized protein n=1 Tax=Mycena chlorophos TaxID=658473 RepID=A0ABQ0L8H0_MYCCL|nr:predicted protein [Mycena chlorophos]